MISVVIVGFNCAMTIRATLESVLTQESQPAEIIFVDDGSTDDTRRIVLEFPSVRLLVQENQGPGVARNHGVKYSQGEYVAFLDSDDLWFPWTLAVFEELIRRCAGPSLVAGSLRAFEDVQDLKSVHREATAFREFPDYFSSSGDRCFVGSGMMLVKKAAFEHAGGFTTKRIYAEDMDLALRLGTSRGFVQVAAPITLGYRQHAANSSKNSALIFDGLLHLVRNEVEGNYPGERSRRHQCRELITLFARPTSLDFLRRGERRLGWQLFWATLSWHLQQCRIRYLLAFPVLGLWSRMRAEVE